MAQDIVNKNQDISYTNLDFSSIYTEVINLAKQLSYRWDPSISDESDPGVVLLKLSALIADKMNYNIDKSALESFPLSVTQEGNAKQLYEQLGYYMNWYESATVPINISWIGGDNDESVMYTIPRFTVVTDSESSRSYAIIGTMNDNSLVISDGKLPKDGTIIQMIAMEGTPVTYTFLGESVITSQMVDEKNRLYFETKYISQNGVFIRNIGNDQDNYLEWKRVDNLYEQPYNDLRYKFGIDSSTDTAYLEFPDNYAEIIGSGIEIIYMVIDPEFSNVPAKTLDRFLVSFAPQEDTTITFSLDNIKIENPSSAIGHKGVESIDDAYTNYKRTVGTFKTLITLRDYLNYILLEGQEVASNGFVTDRTNDPQVSYKVMSTINGSDSLITNIESDTKYITDTYNTQATEEYKVPKMTPFSLKLYLLQDVIAANSKVNFEQTFEMMTSEDLPDIESFLEDTSHIQHTYEDILEADVDKYIPTQDVEVDPYKSYYYLDSQGNYHFIASTYYVNTADTSAQEGTVYYKYNEQYDYFYVYQVEPGTVFSDASLIYELRDSSSVNNPHDNGWYEIDIQGFSKHIAFLRAKYPINMTITTYSVVGPDIQADIKQNILTALYNGLNSSEIEFGDKIELDYLTKIVMDSDTRITSVLFDNIEYNIEAIYYDKVRGFVGIILPTEYDLPNFRDKSEYSGFRIGKEIVAKSILAGTSKLLDKDTQFEYHLDQEFVGLVSNIDTIKSEVIVDIGSQASYVTGGKLGKSYTLKENEVINLVEPKLTNITTYENGVQFEYRIYSDISADQSYQLSSGEYLVVYTTQLNSNGQVEGYIINTYTDGAIIKPSFYVNANTSITSLSSYFKSQILPTIPSLGGNTFENSTYSGYWVSQIQNNVTLTNSTLTGTESITIQDTNQRTFVPSDGYKFYWSLNKEEKSEATNKKYYELFGEYNPETDKLNNASINTYTLKSGETFWVTDKDNKQLFQLGSGSTITRIGGLNTAYSEDIGTDNKISFIKVGTGSAGIVDSIEQIDGISLVQEDDSSISAITNGLYYSENAEPTTYTDYVVSDGTEGEVSYYVLLMKSLNGYYEVHETASGTNSYSISPSITYSVFENVDFADEDINQIDPSDLDLYERVSYENIIIEDSYAASNGENTESTIVSRPRYKKTSDKNIFSENLYSTVSGFTNFVVNDTSTYPEEGYVELNSDVYAEVSPVLNNLYEVDVVDNPTYYSFYDIDVTKIIEPTGNPSERGWYELVNNVYTLSLDTTVISSKTYYSLSIVNVTPTVNDVPTDIGWYEQYDGGGYYLSTKVYSYIPTSISLSKASSPYVQHIGELLTGKGLYYKASDTSIVYIENNIGLSSGYVPISLTYKEIPDNLHSYISSQLIANSGEWDNVKYDNWDENICSVNPLEFCLPLRTPEGLYEITPTISVDTAVDVSKTYYSYNSNKGTYTEVVPGESDNPSEKGWYEIVATETNDTTMNPEKSYYEYSDETYTLIKVSQYYAYTSTEVLSSLTSGSTLSSDCLIIPFGTIDSVFCYAVNPAAATALGLSGGDELSISFDTFETVSTNDLQYWYKAVDVHGVSASFPLYFKPTYYKFRYLQEVDFSKYYQLKTYVDKTFDTLPPWECSSITLDEIVNDPINSLTDFWVVLQDNTSIMIQENNVYSLGEGSVISFLSNQSLSASSIDNVSWPVLSNDEIILNLDNYDVSYTTNNETYSLEKIGISGSEWRAYSNLLVNTSSANGQTLLDNQYITFISGTDEYAYDGNEGEIIVQLQHPINNQAGSSIEVISYDDLGNEILNCAYIYMKLLSSDTVSYATNHETYIQFENIKDMVGTYSIQLPFNVQDGEYLIPMTVPEDNMGLVVDLETPETDTYSLVSNKSLSDNLFKVTATQVGEMEPGNTYFTTNGIDYSGFNLSGYDVNNYILYRVDNSEEEGYSLFSLSDDGEEVSIVTGSDNLSVPYMVYIHKDDETYTYDTVVINDINSIISNYYDVFEMIKTVTQADMSFSVSSDNSFVSTKHYYRQVSASSYNLATPVSEELYEYVDPGTGTATYILSTDTEFIVDKYYFYLSNGTYYQASPSDCSLYECTTNPSTSNWLEETNGVYGYTTDTSVDPEKTYYMLNVEGIVGDPVFYIQDQESIKMLSMGLSDIETFIEEGEYRTSVIFYTYNSEDIYPNDTAYYIPALYTKEQTYTQYLLESITEGTTLYTLETESVSEVDESTFEYITGDIGKYVPIRSYSLGIPYVLSTDTSIDTTKTYYELVGEDDIYIPVTPGEGDNPSEEGWYERSTSGAYAQVYNTAGTYYLYIDFDYEEYTNIFLNFKIDSSNPIYKNVILGDLFKFVPHYENEIAQEMLLNKCKQLDVDSVYNYTYTPDSNELIDNPLDPKMFWDKNHIFNQYTIAQLDTSSSTNITYRFITSR